MYQTDQNELTFRKSSYSATQNDCVEVAHLSRGAAVRDTKSRELGHLAFADAHEWHAFLASARHADV
ncbi:DUF397 domain-containing protein [Nocardiopsis sp. EMB25]|uniref:DUF397 domain-containing protein n=1 Tax=Nocardiopsis TaxID=2013 RepID=UPI00034CFE9E|nr:MULTISPECIES: DUF397 domain-containing protein [Nocardiopsis]MCY9786907.1 DUF397 domain-containing protein [Nocardiopsis sp. EMB25]